MSRSGLSPFVRRALPGLRHHWRAWRGYILFFCFVWVPLRSSVIDYSPVPSGSMNPTILEGDVVWIDKLAYSLRLPLTRIHLADWAEPARGDIVVVISPAADRTRLVKRVVGVPGDTLEMIGRQLWLNGQPVNYSPPQADYTEQIDRDLRPHALFAEEDLGNGRTHAVMGLRLTRPPADWGPLTVPEDQLFVMGDSRDNSADSRAFGFARREDVLGRAKGILVSLDLNDTYLPRWNRTFRSLR